MKTFFVKNLIVVFALLLGIGTMSFKVSNKINFETYWFEVDSSGSISSTPHTPGPECSESIADEFCAVAFSTSTPPVSNIIQTQLGGGSIPVDGVLYKERD